MRLLFLALCCTLLHAQAKAECIVVKLRRAAALTADNALHPSWEEKRAKIRLPVEDWEETFVDEEDEADKSISQCFIPQIKIITERYTFVISLACENFVTYQNKAPFVPSEVRTLNPFGFSDEFRYFIEKAVEKHLKIPPKRLYAEYALAYVPPQPEISYDDLDFLVNQSQEILENQEEEEEDVLAPEESPKDWMDTEEGLEDEND